MNVLSAIWTGLQVLIGYNLVLPLLLWVAYRFKRRYQPPAVNDQTRPDYAVIITAYRHVGQVPQAVQSILQSTYTHFHIYVVADACDYSPLLDFNDARISVLYPETVLAGNTRSHFYAINRFVRPHSHLTIVDSDNEVEPGMLAAFNPWFAAGFQAVQGERRPKNIDTTVARLDAARDLYYHFYDGEALFQLGSSATLAGSGMAFSVALYRDCLENHPISGAGFDKVLQYQILRRGERIAFAPAAVIYDEKTAATDQLVNQRARWINTWFKYFGYGFVLIAQGLTRLSWNRILFGLILLRPPLFIFLLLGLCFAFIDLFINASQTLVWLLGYGCFVLGFILALRHSATDPRIWASLRSIPTFMFYQVKSLLLSRRANQRSVATVHAAAKTNAHEEQETA